jgi:hypothetical protein
MQHFNVAKIAKAAKFDEVAGKFARAKSTTEAEWLFNREQAQAFRRLALTNYIEAWKAAHQ